MNQELTLLIGHVDLTTAEISLYNVGAALAHPNIRDAGGLVAYIGPADQDMKDGVLHLSLGDPILKWSAAQLADRECERKSYEVLKQWLSLDRWNRRCRTIGMYAQTRWTTNEPPTRGLIGVHWNPTRATEVLSDMVPAIQVIAANAIGHQSLSDSVLGVIKWMREQSVDPDPSGSLSLMLVLNSARSRLDEGLREYLEASLAIQFIGISDTSDDFAFWVQYANREGKMNAEKHKGSVAEIEALGFVVGVDPKTNRVTRLDVAESWLLQRGLEREGGHNEVLLLRNVSNKAT